jgi:teichuronic acid biosynthesis glycosyltransferase TuaH
MHIPYEWAKQRPQFLAEELSAFFDLSIGTIESFRKGNLRKEKTPTKHKRSHVLPLGHKSSFVRRLNSILIGKQLQSIIKSNEIIWITHPKLWPAIKPYLSENHVVIYDCMDNVIEFPKEKKNILLRKETQSFEKDLLQNANISIFSSETLMKTLAERYKTKGKNWNVLNNGISGNLLEHFENQNVIKPILKFSKKRVVYLGTISLWFNFDLIINSLKKHSNLEIHLYGPKEVEIPPHDGLFYHGPIPHSQIFEILELSDCLIMPFKINSLIESVNPVKLYEYIASGKPSIAPNYHESSHFKDFVHLYDSEAEWDFLITELINNRLSSKQDQKTALTFCRKNTWKQRALTIKTILSQIN